MASSILIPISAITTLLLATSGGLTPRGHALAPLPFGTIPSQRQVDHSRLETYAFLHFTVNTFTDREWGNGDEPESVFNPTDFNPDQIVLALKAAGMKGAILTAKHHDGFCLWPTKTTAHNISHSPWRNGKGDVVKEISDACKRHGLKFGVYLSPWDRNNAAYGKPEYVATYREQLKELLTNYGPIFEVWHDGANGGTGFYGGAREERSIDRRTYYDWPTTWEMIRKLQPNACIFSDIGPDLRWVGNEAGIAPETSWATYDPVGKNNDEAAPGYLKEELSPKGTRHGKQWLPAECDVSIRPGWFWHESEDSKVKNPDQLFNLYCESVGRGASFLLNVPPDRKGQIDVPDVTSLKKFGKLMRQTFTQNLAQGAKVQATNVRGNDRHFSAENLLSSNPLNYWATDDAVTLPTVELDFPNTRTFDLLRIREPIQLGQRIGGIAIDVMKGEEWVEAGHATSVGNCRIIAFPHPISTNRVRLRITESPTCVLLYDLGLFLRARAE